MIYDNILETIGSTPVVKINSIGKELECNLYAKIEMVNPGGSVKDRSSFRMIDEAEKDSSVEKIKFVMENTHSQYKNFPVPLLVDYGFGNNWGDAH